ncbi:rhamnulokinase family protein [Paenibacillus thermoaerophilus]|uniref:Rhamnulokinase family protein n=1 Tax=Paenibacillus thermoaerophilus TaxID=1215385 RepID=A0ABW2V8Y6_9BACL|nr:rhamnulokinase family protein [Paenibacillus thermoaerophilus]TMV17949.1 rhamnulokinase [Paenibacillus thermoaerophilus]
MKALAFDLGAGSGRAIVGEWTKDDRLVLTETHRFANEPVRAGRRLHWDILRLYHEVKLGLAASARAADGPIDSIGIDSWAVDFGLLDRNGDLLGNPVHYRDSRTDGLMEAAWQIVPKEEMFSRTGLQFLPFNTLYQLWAMKREKSPLLEAADKLLMIPDLLRYFLTGQTFGEYTNASTTQFLNASTRRWDTELLERFGLPSGILPEVAQPATVIGTLRASVREELGIPGIPVVAVGEHDTASAVAGVPAADGKPFAYLICGTWSLLGTETAVPVLGADAMRFNFTNEGGLGGTYRLLKNIMGLWLIQECKRLWDRQGVRRSYGEWAELAAREKPFLAFVDPDDDSFLAPAGMPAAIRAFCRKTGQPEPETEAQVMRVVTDSLALKARYVLERLERLTGIAYGGLHMVGGGIQNEALCQSTANAIGRPVWAGPVEASAIGNLAAQFMANGRLSDLAEARRWIAASIDIREYEPQNKNEWEDAYGRFVRYVV